MLLGQGRGGRTEDRHRRGTTAADTKGTATNPMGRRASAGGMETHVPLGTVVWKARLQRVGQGRGQPWYWARRGLQSQPPGAVGGFLLPTEAYGA